MPTRLREVHRPPDLPSALQLLGRAAVRTAPLFIGPRPAAVFEGDAEAGLDLSRLDLGYVKRDGGVIRLGSTTPLQWLAESPELTSPTRDLIAEAVEYAAHPGLRNVATVGGVLLSPGGPPDVLLALLALDAAVILRGGTTRETRLAEFLAGPRPAPDELIVEAKFAELPAHAGSASARVARTPRDEAIVAVVAVVTADSARVAVGGASQTPFCNAATGPIDNHELQHLAASIESAASPIADYRGSAEYRREMAGVLARRALEDAWHKTKK